jgi:hypothetical protein
VLLHHLPAVSNKSKACIPGTIEEVSQVNIRLPIRDRVVPGPSSMTAIIILFSPRIPVVSDRPQGQMASRLLPQLPPLALSGPIQ